jgi:hypothetical protein
MDRFGLMQEAVVHYAAKATAFSKPSVTDLVIRDVAEAPGD